MLYFSTEYSLEVFDRFVDLPRLPLTDAICIDEVHIDMDGDSKYALVIQDFYTGEPIDLLPSRKQSVTESYFSSIPPEERFQVKYLVSDMYAEYLRYTSKYFPNAVSVVDSFHVIQWINMALDNHIRQLQNKFEERDRRREEEASIRSGRSIHLPMSDEIYLLKNYRFFLLSDPNGILYHEDPHIDRHYHYLMNTYDYEAKFFKVDSSLSELRDLKYEYLKFNRVNFGNPQKAARELDMLIKLYSDCSQPIFVEFSKLLKRYREPIIHSFILFERVDSKGNMIPSRLSNGPMESLNRKVKDLKRLGRGYRNFSHLRNRFLFATRQDATLNGKVRKPKDATKSLRFRATVQKSKQKLLLDEMDMLLEKYKDCSKDELLRLKHWISEGNSPYENPDNICDEYGVITDFISASRILDEVLKDEY